jgi:OCT family organic cation transporter-like MFS transporter 4/5
MWFTLSFIYYGLSFDTKKDIGLVFTDGFIIFTAEFISYIISGFIINTKFFGRIKTLSIALLLTGLSSIVYNFLKGTTESEFYPWNKIVLFLIRFNVTAIYLIMYTYSTEVYPTVIRGVGLGINAVCARIAVVFVPIVIEFMSPYYIFTSLALFSFIFSFYLPETRGKILEDEVEEEKNKIKENKQTIMDPLII